MVSRLLKCINGFQRESMDIKMCQGMMMRILRMMMRIMRKMMRIIRMMRRILRMMMMTKRVNGHQEVSRDVNTRIKIMSNLYHIQLIFTNPIGRNLREKGQPHSSRHPSLAQQEDY